MNSDSDTGNPRVPIVCSECETSSRVPLSELADSIERHNDQLHDGADVAEVDPDVADRIADLIAEELGLLEDAS
ncbi:hypothetical protein [Natrarchaeobius chitinivorans]|uniref:DUF8149 domain-containing protein n=1 Tax=Natrarchaeobius chitinivorans TaxID=1679083 RepID=A0A3N6MJE0_NATCH|nr:hypothetical protein [Natrarchaeobius chitinivorans]RQG97200.1 hypothetical protein EA473_03770 [Natrarchaeobius chitinivorans]